MAQPTVNGGKLSRIALFAGTLVLLSTPAAAQRDSARSELQAVLRAFYFNLAHHDWEALSSDVLSAKILASRSLPSNLEIPSEPVSPERCPTTAPRVEQASIRLEGDWAAVAVPVCELPEAGSDRFRLVRLEEHWRFVYINVFDPLMVVSTDRQPGTLRAGRVTSF